MARFAITLASPQSTGAGRMALEFAKAFIRRGHEVTLIHGPIPTTIKAITPEMISAGVSAVLYPDLALPLPWKTKAFGNLLIKSQFNAIIAFNQLDRAFSMQAAVHAGIPGFISCQNTHNFHGNWIVKQVKRYLYATSLRKYANLIFCVSPVVQKEIVEDLGIPIEKTTILNNGIDVSIHQPISAIKREALRSSLGVAPDEDMMINVGRIDKQKGHDVLARALTKINFKDHKTKFVIVGGASETARANTTESFFTDLKSFVSQNKLDDRLIFAGWRNDVPDLLQAADAYVHSARWEGFPLACLEAMAASLPSIWTDCSGHPDGFVEGTHGWVARANDPDSLGQSITKMMGTSKEQRVVMGRACRQLVEKNFDIQIIGNRFVETIEKASLTSR
jgi:glycosyltransferase involved in cell wall biosynthesis